MGKCWHREKRVTCGLSVWASLVAQMVKNLPGLETWVDETCSVVLSTPQDHYYNSVLQQSSLGLVPRHLSSPVLIPDSADAHVSKMGNSIGPLNSQASLVAQRLKRLPPIRETRVRSLGQEDPLEKEMAIHSSILAWRIPWMEEIGRLQSTGSQRVGHD